jgi:hypothetical protein
MAPRSRAIQCEDLPNEIRARIFEELRKVRMAAAMVFQKMLRGRFPSLVYKSSVRFRVADITQRPFSQVYDMERTWLSAPGLSPRATVRERVLRAIDSRDHVRSHEWPYDSPPTMRP